LSREELIAGIGGSVLVHGLIFAIVLLAPWAMPKKKFEMPYCSVNLVSMQELGAGAPASKKGVTSKAAEGPKSQEAAHKSSSTAAKSAPLVPVKRLRMEEAPAKPQTELKRLEPREAPKIPERTASAASVEKDLDKLITKPKAPPKPAPIVQQSSSASSEEDEKPSSNREPAAKSTQTASGGGDQKGAKGAAGPQGSPKGTEEGTARGDTDGVAKGNATGAPAGGSPNGAMVTSARQQYALAVYNAIRRNWSIPEFLKSQKLEAHLVLVLRRDGKVLDVQFERRSGQPLFDHSVESAVRKADPLPPFPEVYSPSKEEFSLRFRPDGRS
jgi:TonB family protein